MDVSASDELNVLRNGYRVYLESDKTYLMDNEKVKGFFFIVFLALRIRLKILRVLKDHNLLGKMSAN